MKTIKNYFVAGLIGLGGLGIFGNVSYWQKNYNKDTAYKINPLKKFINQGNQLDSLQDLATENYNHARINLNKCILREKNDLPCFNIFLEYLPLSKKALEEYISFFEKSKIYEDSTFTMEMGRDLSISEAKEWVKNEELMIDYASKFLESPSKEKEKILADHFSYTTKCTNSYFPPEGTIDIGVFEDK
ncbi:MAG: hypothetical protein QT10_C0001G0039 [archaeon GW2011_AR19]|nr:MAG: hypothetical protein QT10_C0001G0039 [archaeon GW2011_AR19]